MEFNSSTIPQNATVSASVTSDVLGTFSDLTMEWQDSGGTALETTSVSSPLTELDTTFTSSDTNQILSFNWTDSTAQQGFDYDVSPAPIPLPAGVCLLLSALGGLGVLQYRRSKTA